LSEPSSERQLQRRRIEEAVMIRAPLDRWTRLFATSRPRRHTTRLLVGTVAGALLVRFDLAETRAGCARAGKKCDKENKCCAGAKCQGGKCRCKSGLTQCGSRCVNTETNPNHCGDCDVPCADGAGTCILGGCFPPEVCNGIDDDVDGQTDEGDLCPRNQVCVAGACVCPEGTQDCDGDGRCEPVPCEP
jgi:hypothetical protein